MEEKPLWWFDQLSDPGRRGIPAYYSKFGDSNDGELRVYPTPYNETAPYGLKQTYYADVMEEDLDSAKMATLYKRWRNVWIAGVYAKALQGKDDRDNEAKIEYVALLQSLIGRERYGVDISSLQQTVSD